MPKSMPMPASTAPMTAVIGVIDRANSEKTPKPVRIPSATGTNTTGKLRTWRYASRKRIWMSTSEPATLIVMSRRIDRALKSAIA